MGRNGRGTRPLRPARSLSLGSSPYMSCTCPLDAWPAPPGAPDRRPVWSPHKSFAGAQPFKLPCGQCMGCRLDRAQELSTRAVHEAQMMWEEGRGSCFVTLTYAPEHLPGDLSVSVEAAQRYHYRLRKLIGPFRFLLAAEYGDKDLRPHMHVCYFGHDFREDRYFWKSSKGGRLYRSPTLEKAWPYGHALIADFTRETGGYTARYTTKKVGGDMSEERYRRTRFDPETGEFFSWQVRPEFMLCSRRPGLGASWFEKYKDDVFPADFLIIDGRKVPVPRYYTEKLAEGQRADLAIRRAENARRHVENNTERRLMTRHESQLLRAERLVRPLEGDDA